MDSTQSDKVLAVKKQITQAWANLQKIAESENQQTLIEGFEKHIRQMQAGIFHLVVMGEIKKGKSSFINALLGEEDLLPTASDVATSTVYQIIYGPEKKLNVYLLPDIDTGERPPPLEIIEDQISEYGTEDGNPDNVKRVDFISVEIPNELLKTGLVIVDTPGVGGLFKKHKQITWKYAPNADAIFFVLDSVETVISQDEISFLQELTEKMTKRIYFVQTKIDIPGEEQWRSWEKRNKDILLDKLDISDSSLTYLPVSSKLKQRGDKKQKERFIVDSGFPAVMNFLTGDLIASKDMMICGEITSSMLSFFKEIKAAVNQRIRISQADTKEKLDDIQQDLEKAVKEITEWEKSTYKMIIQTFTDKFQEIKDKLTDKLEDELNPHGHSINAIIQKIRDDQSLSAEELNEKAGALQQSIVDGASEIVIQIQEEFNGEMTDLMTDCATRLQTSLNDNNELTVTAVQNANVSEGFLVPIQNSLNMQFSAFDSMRQGLYGGMAGGMLGSIASGILTFVFPPAGAIAWLATVATLGGGLFGGYQASQLSKGRQKAQAAQQLENLFAKTMSQLQKSAMKNFGKMVRESEKNAKKLFDQALEAAKSKLERQRGELNSARKANTDELRKAVDDAREVIVNIDSSVKMISGIEK